VFKLAYLLIESIYWPSGSATNSINITVKPPVAMTAKLVGNSILISWPGNAVNYTLQMTASLLPPTTWSTAPVTPVKVNGQVIATVTPTGNRQFYRLSQ